MRKGENTRICVFSLFFRLFCIQFATRVENRAISDEVSTMDLGMKFSTKFIVDLDLAIIYLRGIHISSTLEVNMSLS